jgi:hypothetical protein
LFEICPVLRYCFPHLKALQVTVHRGVLGALTAQLQDIAETWFRNRDSLRCIVLREYLEFEQQQQPHEAMMDQDHQAAVVFVREEGTLNLKRREDRMAVEHAWNTLDRDLGEQARFVLSAGVESCYFSSVSG